MRMAAIVFLFLLLGFSLKVQWLPVSHAYDSASVDLDIRLRAEAYSSYNLSQDLIGNINNSENFELRTNLLQEGPNPTGRNINTDLANQASDYMARVNRRATLTTEGLAAVQENGGSVSSNGASTVEPPNQAQLQNTLEEIDLERKRKSGDFLNRWAKNNNAQLQELIPSGGPDYGNMKQAFDNAGLGELFQQIDDYSYNGGADKRARRKIIQGLAEAKDTLAEMGLKSWNNVVQSAVTTQQSFEKFSADADRATADANNQFQQQQKQYQEAVSSGPSEKQKALTQKQAQLDKEFFDKNNLSAISGLDEMTSNERAKLLGDRKLKSLLQSRDPSKAIEYVNKIREQGRNFILNVSRLSNAATEANRTGNAPKAPPEFKKQAEKMTSAAKNRGDMSKYREHIRGGFRSLKRAGLDTLTELGVSDRGRLAILDGLTDGHISPNQKISLMIKTQRTPGTSASFSGSLELRGVDVTKLMEEVSKVDGNAKKAIAELILENGSDSQVRALKISEPGIINQIKITKDINKLRCKGRR